MENPNFNFQVRILFSSENSIRYQGSSGGVITEIVKYLFHNKSIKSSIGFKFIGIDLFKPYFISSFEEYNQSGSVYHEIEIYKFLKENITQVKSPILITCLPCQVMPIKRLLLKNDIESIIISLVCSSQLEKEATYYFLKKNEINISEVTEFKYRGNGWPSGMQIKTNNKEYFFHNNNSQWMDIFHSQIFNLNRCFSCKDTFGLKADITIGDPWLKRYVQNDNLGTSMVIAHTNLGESIITNMMANHKLKFVETLTSDETIFSQKGTLIKKYIFRKYRKKWMKLIKLFRTKFYTNNFYYFSFIHRYVIFITIKILYKLRG